MTEQMSTPTPSPAWQRVSVALFTAKGIAWDGCHKIYVLMDEEQMRQMEDCGYDPLLPVTDADKALETVRQWWDDSCSLRFVSAVKTVEDDPNKGFLDLIAQFEENVDA